jgi:hypothetical protein
LGHALALPSFAISEYAGADGWRSHNVTVTRGTEQQGYSALWYPEALGYESFALGAFLLAHTGLVWR